MNSYIRLSEFRRLLGSGVSNRDADLRMLAKLEQVSREFDRDTGGNHLYARVATRYYRQGSRSRPASELCIDPVVSLTSVGVRWDSSDSYTSLTENTDYWAEPNERAEHTPIRRLVIIPSSTNLGTWPGYDERAVQVVGVFGYSYEVAATGAVVADNPLTSGATTLTLASGHGIDVGETLKIESEQVAVVAQPNMSATTLTIERGVNGTTAAQHAQNTVIYRRVYPRDAVETLAERARSLWSDEYRGGAPTSDFIGSGVSNFQPWPRYRELVGRYMLGRAVL